MGGCGDLNEVLANKQVRTVFQPIVDLDAGCVVAYEALARGPVGDWERPDVLFAEARSQGRLAELDSLCRSTALRTAIEVGLTPPLALFVNVEPDVIEFDPLDELIDIAATAPEGMRLVLEITERAIGSRPAELLACVRRLRAAGWRIALDDVGADDMSLAFMPLLRPDIVKLDLKLVQERPGPAVAEIMNAVNAYAQRSGAVLLAEGIEDEAHLSVARALGARLGQGWMFGRPSPTLTSSLQQAEFVLPAVAAPSTDDSPFGCLPPDQHLRVSTKPLLIELSKHLEREAMRYGPTCVVVSTFQHARHFTPATAHRYRELAERTAFVAAIGEGLSTMPVQGVRGADIAHGDPLQGEWDIAVLAPHFSAALLARDLGDQGPDRSRRFEFALTYERETVAAAAESLLSRIAPTAPLTTSSWAGGLPAATRDALLSLSAPSPRTAGDRSDSPSPTLALMLRRALAASTNGVSIADVTRPDHPLIYVNTAFERLSGLRAEDILGSNCRVLQGEDTDPAAIERIRTALALGVECRETVVNYRGPDREPWWNEIYLSPVFDHDGRLVQYIGIQNDVTARVTAEAHLQSERRRSAEYLAEIENLAFHDPLTGLLNRRRLDEMLSAALLDAQLAGTSTALLYLDIDGFKKVNDTYGHAVGDRVLREAASRLRGRLRHGDLIARLGGDEFLIVLTDVAGGNARQDAERIADSCQRLFDEAIDEHSLSVSVGLSVYPDDGNDFDALLHAADLRMYASKKRKQLFGSTVQDSHSVIGG